jgi:hypothetical protein
MGYNDMEKSTLLVAFTDFEVIQSTYTNILFIKIFLLYTFPLPFLINCLIVNTELLFYTKGIARVYDW